MASPALSRFLPRFGVAAAVASALGLAGCQSLNSQDTLPPPFPACSRSRAWRRMFPYGVTARACR